MTLILKRTCLRKKTIKDLRKLIGDRRNPLKILSKAKKHHANSILCTAFGYSQKALKQYTKAEKNYWQASNMTPSKFYPQYLLAKLYDETGQQQKAVDMATSLLKKAVKIESTAIEEIYREMKEIIERNAEGNSLFKEKIQLMGKKSEIATLLRKRQLWLPCL